MNRIIFLFSAFIVLIKPISSITKPSQSILIINSFNSSICLLLSNYYKYNNQDIKNKNTIKDKNGSVIYHVIEDKYGTIFYSDKIFNGKELLKLDNVLYFYINSSFFDKNNILDFINDKEIDNSDNGFLDKKTIYKLKED